MEEFFEDFFRVFIGITVALLYLGIGLLGIVAPFVFIGGAAGATLGIFAGIAFVSLTITITEHL